MDSTWEKGENPTCTIELKYLIPVRPKDGSFNDDVTIIFINVSALIFEGNMLDPQRINRNFPVH